MKRLFLAFLAIVFPWVVMLIYDNPGGALIAIIMQATIVGWIPASMWAWRTVHGTTKHQTKTHSGPPANPH